MSGRLVRVVATVVVVRFIRTSRVTGTMPSVTVPPVEEAARLFRRLGYTVDDGGREFDARRKWRTVRVTVLAPDEAEGASALADGGCPCDGA